MTDQTERLIYVTETGGLFKFAQPDQFDEAIRTGKLDVTPVWQDQGPREIVEPTYMAIVKPVRDYDFVLKRPRLSGGT